MIYIVIETNNLRQYFEDEKGKLYSMKSEDCGLLFDNKYVLHRKNKELVYLVEIVDIEKAKARIDKMNLVVKDGVENFNEDLDKYYEENYNIYNEGMLNADYQLKASKDLIDISEIQSDWTEIQRNEWYYKNGLNGIKTGNKPEYK